MCFWSRKSQVTDHHDRPHLPNKTFSAKSTKHIFKSLQETHYRLILDVYTRYVAASMVTDTHTHTQTPRVNKLESTVLILDLAQVEGDDYDSAGMGVTRVLQPEIRHAWRPRIGNLLYLLNPDTLIMLHYHKPQPKAVKVVSYEGAM